MTSSRGIAVSGSAWPLPSSDSVTLKTRSDEPAALGGCGSPDPFGSPQIWTGSVWIGRLY